MEGSQTVLLEEMGLPERGEQNQEGFQPPVPWLAEQRQGYQPFQSRRSGFLRSAARQGWKKR